jgi:putative ABC transport system substrate-binding protein
MRPHHLLIVAALTIFVKTWADEPPKVPLVVISQIVEHDALTKEREGIIAALKDAGFEDGKTITIVYENAQGSIATATLIANKFAGLSPRVAIGISTPSAQTLIQPMADRGIPVVFAAVTDPIEARLVSTLDKRSENVTGVSDGLPFRPQMELIQKLIPGLKTIGVLYNPGEANSAKAVLQLRELAPLMKLSLVEATTSRTADTLMAATSLIGKADIIFIPLDNTAMASISGIVALGRAHKMPVFTPDFDSVENGVLAVRAPSHRAMGYKAGQLVAKILKGEKAGDLPVVTEHPLDLKINIKSAEIIGISIPDELKKTAKLLS